MTKQNLAIIFRWICKHPFAATYFGLILFFLFGCVGELWPAKLSSIPGIYEYQIRPTDKIQLKPDGKYEHWIEGRKITGRWTLQRDWDMTSIVVQLDEGESEDNNPPRIVVTWFGHVRELRFSSKDSGWKKRSP